MVAPRRGVLAFARRLAIAELGTPPQELRPLAGGLRNTVIGIRHRHGQFVLHLGRAREQAAVFAKERWAMAMARAAVPTPRILARGTRDGWAYLLSQRARGAAGDASPDRLRTLRALGRLAARLHRIHGSGFGTRFVVGEDELVVRPTWRRYLDEELGLAPRLQALAAQRLIDAGVCERIRRVLLAPQLQHTLPVLIHGDLRLKNVVVDARGEIRALIDWEHAGMNLPQWDLSIALHDLTIDEKEAFLAGYRPADMPAMAATLTALNLLNYASLVAHRRLRQQERARLRVRLSGALDLFRL